VEKVCLIGAGSTKYGKLEDSITDIALQASVDAIESAISVMLSSNLPYFVLPAPIRQTFSTNLAD
jgi:hypothetical protein